MIWSEIVFVAGFVSVAYFLRGLVRVARCRELLEHEQLREARQLRRLSRRGK